MKQFYVDTRFSPENRALIDQIDGILEEYIGKYVITVRTLYYQLVARDIIPNNERSYKRITGLVNDARLAGLLDWDVLTDRGRSVLDRPHWDDAQAFIAAVMPQFYTDHWDNQEERVIVVVEKDALAGVLEGTCRAYDVPLLAAKGYPSASALREMAEERLIPALERGQRLTLLHLGDHDPSGKDMTRDLEDRLRLFIGEDLEDGFELERIALNYNQIEEQKPPPNPAKITDSRAEKYIAQYGRESWELDALSPDYLNNLLISHITDHMDERDWKVKDKEIKDTRAQLLALGKKL